LQEFIRTYWEALYAVISN